MKFNNYSETFVLENGATMLVYLVNEGKDTIIHHVMWPECIGTVDMSMTLQCDDIDMIFEAVSQEEAQTAYDDKLKSLIEKMGSIDNGENDDSDGNL